METLRRLDRTAIGIIAIIALAALLTLAAAPSGAAAAACAASIVDCGCTIDSPGTYKLSGSSPMHSAGTCVNITASNVTLMGGPALQGPGATTATFGIHIEASASKVILESIETEDFGQGIRVDGVNATVLNSSTGGNHKGVVVNGANAFLLDEVSEMDDVVGIQVDATATDFVMVSGEADGASDAGFKLAGVNGAFLDGAIALGNGKFGIWLLSASYNDFDGFTAESNGIAGVYLGCNPAGPDGTRCPFGTSSSNGNTLIGSVYGTVNSFVSNTGSPLNQHFGIAVSLGNLHNHFVRITGTDNMDDDARDENPNCGSNRWVGDSFTTSSPAKGTTLTCLN